jgi:predicted small lipoprotein YifL
MKHLLQFPAIKGFALILCLAFLTGCPSLTPLHRPTTEVLTPAQQAQKAARIAVDEANAALTALNRTIAQNVMEGIWTKAQGQSALDESKAQGRNVDKAITALEAGLYLDAQNQAELAKRVILSLHKKASEKARAQ